jgi:hypothetical protein
MSDLIKQILEKGYYEVYEPEGLGLINLDEFKLINVEERARDNGVKDIPSELAKRLNTFAQYLKIKYIDSNWDNAVYNKFIVWEGVDRDNQGWHTDMFEGYDIFLLYYFDDTKKETGGNIQFKWKDGEAIYQPSAGSLFLVNNCRGFWHKAGSSTITRRVASFDFNVGLKNE